jgi:hypothetical protein
MDASWYDEVAEVLNVLLKRAFRLIQSVRPNQNGNSNFSDLPVLTIGVLLRGQMRESLPENVQSPNRPPPAAPPTGRLRGTNSSFQSRIYIVIYSGSQSAVKTGCGCIDD